MRVKHGDDWMAAVISIGLVADGPPVNNGASHGGAAVKRRER